MTCERSWPEHITAKMPLERSGAGCTLFGLNRRAVFGGRCVSCVRSPLRFNMGTVLGPGLLAAGAFIFFAAYSFLGAPDRGEYRQAAGAVAEVTTRGKATAGRPPPYYLAFD